MSAPRLVLQIAVSIVAFQAFAVAQTMPAPVESKPPAAQAPPPGYQAPPPGYQQRPQAPPPGYQQPPPGYQPPPPGYQQQPPPGYQQAPPAYPQGYQPPPGYQAPPPGYYQPPPAYYPPPGYYPPVTYQPPPPLPLLPPGPPPRTHGFLAMPYLGVATQTGEQGQRYSSGGIFGAIVGGRLNRAFSLNGELRLDSLDFRNVPSTTAASGTELDIGFSPLFHAQFATGEFLIGPKLSFFTHQESYTGFDINGFYTEYHEDWTGWSVGVNTGLFFAVSRFMSLGGMVSYTLRMPTEVCTRMDFSTIEDCQSGDYPAANVLGFHAAALF